jgi:hypothetical protein
LPTIWAKPRLYAVVTRAPLLRGGAFVQNWGCRRGIPENFSDRRLITQASGSSCAATRRTAASFREFRIIDVVSMKILGIQLRQPSFNEVTASAVMAAGLWLATVALFRVTEQPMDRFQAGAALLVIFWSCVGVRMGIRLDKGLRHVAVNVLCGGVILMVYNALMTLFA